jgi:Na+/melibiose symporter-like transporter
VFEAKNDINAMSSAAKTSSLFEISDDRVSGEELRLSISRIILGWGFGSAYLSTIGGAVYAVFIRSLSTDDFLFGLLAAAMPFMSILQVVSARIIERTGHRKRQLVVNLVIGRCLWLLAALLPLLWIYFPERISKENTFNLVMICIAASGVFQALAGPAFFPWIADLIPEKVRPAFLAHRMKVGTLTACGAGLLCGAIADTFPSLTVYCVILALSAVAGLIEIIVLFGVKEPAASIPHTGSDTRTPFFESLREPLREPAVRSFLLFSSLLYAGYGLQMPLLWLYSLEFLGLSKTMTAFLASILPLLAVAWTLSFWRGVVQQYGTRPVMRLCALGLVFMPIGWVCAQPGEWRGLLLFGAMAGVLWGALDLCQQTLVTRISPTVPRPTLAALFAIASGMSLAAGSVLCGWLARYLQGLEIEWFGFTVINFHVIFLCVMLLRIINAFMIAPHLREPEAPSTLETVKEIIPELAQSFANLLSRPVSR